MNDPGANSRTVVIAGSGTSVTIEIFGFNFHDLIPRAENPSDFDAVGLGPGTLTDRRSISRSFRISFYLRFRCRGCTYVTMVVLESLVII